MPDDDYERAKTEAYKLVQDLDRCEHGRHEGDSCFNCPNRRSAGNPHIRPGLVMGYDYGGRPYAMPERGERHSRDAWLAAGAEAASIGARAAAFIAGMRDGFKEFPRA